MLDKAAGPSGIVMEMIRTADDTGNTMIRDLVTAIIHDGKVKTDQEQVHCLPVQGQWCSMMYIFRSLFVLQRVCSNVSDFNKRTLFLTAKLLKQGYRYFKIRKAFSQFYHRHSELIVKYNISFKKNFCNKAYQSQYFMVI